MSTRWWQWLAGVGADRRRSAGSITPFVLIAVLALIPLAGLVIDGGRQLNGRARAIAYAQEAARAGAQALDLQVEETRLVPGLAEDLVRQFCDDAMNGADGVPGDPTLTDCRPLLVPDRDNAGDFLTIGVQTRVEVDPLILDIFGTGPLESRGRAVARAFTGIDEADDGAVPTLPPPATLTASGEPLPTIGPGEQGPTGPPLTVSPCATPKPTPTPTPTPSPGDGNGNGNGGGNGNGNGGGNGGGDDDEDPPTTAPTTTPPTTPPPTSVAPPPPNNDLDTDAPPSCAPTTAEGGDGEDQQ